MRRNARQRRTETRSIQRSVQILLVVCGIVFLLAGLVLAASGASVSSAIGSVSDRVDEARQPADGGGDTAASDSAGDGGATDTDGTGGTDTETGETDSTDNTDSQTDGADDTDSQTDGTDSTGTDGGNETQTNESTSESHVLTAVVESQNGDVIDTATVTVDSGSASTVSKSVAANGEAEFVLEDGEYTVTADADGYKTTETTVQVDGADQTITLTLEEQTQAGSGTDDSDGTHTLAVTVEDENGTAIEDATIEVEEETIFGMNEEKPVGNDGVATFELEDGEYTVTADADEYTFEDRTVTIDGGDKSITLTPESTDG